MSVDKVNIEEKIRSSTSAGKPEDSGRADGQHVKLVRFIGEFVWHHHDGG